MFDFGSLSVGLFLFLAKTFSFSFKSTIFFFLIFVVEGGCRVGVGIVYGFSVAVHNGSIGALHEEAAVAEEEVATVFQPLEREGAFDVVGEGIGGEDMFGDFADKNATC